MESGTEFVDYYDLLQVNPDCDARILEVAYHYFAKMYHPDNIETHDADRFQEVVEAYRVLRDPARRAEYDIGYERVKGSPAAPFSLNGDIGIDEKTAINDAEIQTNILMQLYKRRRENASDAGIVGWLLQEKLGCSDEHFEFHVWYLKSKGFVSINEQGKLAITIEGVDHVFSLSRTSSAEKRLLTRSVTAGE